MSDSKVSIIIVNFNGGELLIECVRATLASSVPVEVFVSDNGSSDGSIEFLNQQLDDDRLHCIMNGENLGFAKGSNRVLPMTTGEYLLFLNPDCLIEANTIGHMLKSLDGQTRVGMAGCLIKNPDGSEQAGCRRRVPTPARTLIRVLHLDVPFPFLREKGMIISHEPLPVKPVDIEALSGAFMFVKREAMEEVGLLDEGYFLHCEDLDWCMRFRQKGWKILFVPDVEVTHAKGICSEGRAVRVEWHKHKGMVRFYRKFFRHQYTLPLMLLVIFSVWGRFMAIVVVANLKRLLVRN